MVQLSILGNWQNNALKIPWVLEMSIDGVDQLPSDGPSLVLNRDCQLCHSVIWSLQKRPNQWQHRRRQEEKLEKLKLT